MARRAQIVEPMSHWSCMVQTTALPVYRDNQIHEPMPLLSVYSASQEWIQTGRKCDKGNCGNINYTEIANLHSG